MPTTQSYEERFVEFRKQVKQQQEYIDHLVKENQTLLSELHTLRGEALSAASVDLPPKGER